MRWVMLYRGMGLVEAQGRRIFVRMIQTQKLEGILQDIHLGRSVEVVCHKCKLGASGLWRNCFVDDKDNESRARSGGGAQRVRASQIRVH